MKRRLREERALGPVRNRGSRAGKSGLRHPDLDGPPHVSPGGCLCTTRPGQPSPPRPAGLTWSPVPASVWSYDSCSMPAYYSLGGPGFAKGWAQSGRPEMLEGHLSAFPSFPFLPPPMLFPGGMALDDCLFQDDILRGECPHFPPCSSTFLKKKTGVFPPNPPQF